MIWKPIETAPKDGTIVLLFLSGTPRIKITTGYWDDHKKCNCWVAGGYMQKSQSPTHWMTLPDPPNAKITGGDSRPVD